MVLPMYGMQTTMKYYFRVDSHACTCILVPVNEFNWANLIDTTSHVVWTSYTCHCDEPGASYSYSTGITCGPCCIIAVSFIFTLLGAVSKDKKIYSKNESFKINLSFILP